MLLLALDYHEVQHYELYQKSLGIIGLVNAFILQFVYPLILRRTDSISVVSKRLLTAIGIASVVWYFIYSALTNASLGASIFFAGGHLIFSLGSLFLYTDFVNLMRLKKDEIVHLYPLIISLSQFFALALVIFIFNDFLYYFWFSGVGLIIVHFVVYRSIEDHPKDGITISLKSIKCSFINLYIFF